MNRSRLFILIAGISFIISLVIILKLPAIVPIHWNASGEIDGYGSKWTLLFLSAMPLIIYFGMGLTRKIDPKKAKIDKRPEVYEFFRVLTSSIFIVLNAVILVGTCNLGIDISMIVPFVIGVMLIVMGNYMPRIPQNYFLGFRIPWALDNEKVWIRTQRMGGLAMVISGIVTIIAGFMRGDIAYIIMLGVTAGSILWATIDSYIYFKRVTKKEHEE
ncbi:MAG: SdpI family protein [Beduini sp.]|uniref:SdpI family protein n=1 Tax=Beduini sp. TaxID=1922300 RepID=UPI0011CAF408